jgi:hypothetical protein
MGPLAQQREHQMLRIQKKSDGCMTKLLLSGRIQANHIACVRSAMSDGCAPKTLDLSEVTLIDLYGVRFLIECEDAGIELAQCPSYVRQWVLCERAESVPSDSSRTD